MRALLTSLLLVAASTLLAGSAKPPAGTELEFKIAPISQLPKGIDVYNPEVGEIPNHDVGVARADLDSDGRDDLIINVGGGGTGGSYCFVFHRQRNGYREVLQFMGGASLLAAKNGFREIQVWSRAGGGVETRTVYSYRKGKYVPILSQRYRRLDDDVMELIPNDA